MAAIDLQQRWFLCHDENKLLAFCTVTLLLVYWSSLRNNVYHLRGKKPTVIINPTLPSYTNNGWPNINRNSGEQMTSQLLHKPTYVYVVRQLRASLEFIGGGGGEQGGRKLKNLYLAPNLSPLNFLSFKACR